MNISTTRSPPVRIWSGPPTDCPVLGEIPRIAGWRDREDAHLVTADAPQSPAAESYRTLRTAIEFVAFDRELKSLQVTSSQTDDGKTTTLANLAVAFARSGVQVTIVCCDLRRPRIHEFFGLAERGRVHVGAGRAVHAGRRAAAGRPGEPNLSVLSAGPPPPNPSELLSSGRAADTITSIEKSTASGGLVLVDSPPVLAVGDALIVSGMVDATLLVASADSVVAPGAPASGADAPASRRTAHRHRAQQREARPPGRCLRLRLLGSELERFERPSESAGTPQGRSAPRVSESTNGGAPSASCSRPPSCRALRPGL